METQVQEKHVDFVVTPKLFDPASNWILFKRGDKALSGDLNNCLSYLRNRILTDLTNEAWGNLQPQIQLTCLLRGQAYKEDNWYILADHDNYRAASVSITYVPF